MTAVDVGPGPLLALQPTDEEQRIRESVRQICTAFGPRYARDCHEAGRPPTELWATLAEHGYVGANIPAQWGGAGLGLGVLQIVAEEVAAGGVSMLMLVVSSAISGSILTRHGSDAQKQQWLRGIAAGTTKLAFAITEPDAGTNSHQLRTTLRRDGAGYRLHGQKTFISGIEDADAVLVVARVRQPDGALGKPCLCIIDVDAPGFTREVIPMPYLGPEQQSTLFFDDVAVAADRIVGSEGLGPVFDGLNPERIIIAALANGSARRALDQAAAYARERTVWDAPIGTHQAIAHPLAKCKIELELARLMTQKAAALYDADAPGTGEAANIAKYAAAKAVTHCVDAAIQTHGGNGLAIEYGVSDLWWLARLMRIAPVTSEMILNYIAQHSLALPRSY